MKKLYNLTLTLTLFFTSFCVSQTVFINEIHYDDAGADSGEGVEIAGPSGTDLTNYTITAYNGGNNESYKTLSLTGVIPDLGSSGYGTIFFPISGLQNGAPDGLALDNTGTLIQFLSYEGSPFTASGGPADGITSTDIGVAETGSTPDGHSLQLIGTGTTYENFTWDGPKANTYDAINTDQIFQVLVDPTITISVTSISGLAYVSGNSSIVSESFSVSGLNLNEGITISVPQGFEASEDDTTFSNADIVLPASNGSVSTTQIYVKLSSGQQEGDYSGSLNINSTGLSESVSITGQVYPDSFVSNLSQDLFISEYAEVSSNNKYIEIYNPTDQTIDLSSYAIASVSNDPTIIGWHESFNTFTDNATISSGETYVWANSGSNATILAVATAPTGETGTAYFNGDDAYALVKGTETSYVVLDIIGDFNGDPGSGWDVAGVSSATKDKTLVRRDFVTKGNNNWSSSAGTNSSDSEWVVLDKDDFSFVGSHPHTDATLSIFGFENQRVKVYPNPVEVLLNFSGLTSPVQATVFDMLGKRQLQSEVINSLDVSSLKPGLYMVEIKNENSAKVFNILKK
jgi:hypothetical protein